MKEKLKRIFGRNKNELVTIENSKNLSKEVKKDRKNIIEKENEVIEHYQDTYDKNTKRIEELELSKNDVNNSNFLINREINDLKNEINEAELDLRREKQGKVRDIISAYIGQVDKKIYNMIFSSNNKLSEKLFKFYKNSVQNRYIDLDTYMEKNAFIVVLLIIGGVVLSKLSLPMFAYITYALSGLLATNSIIKSISTWFNLKKFKSSPKIENFKNLFHGNRKEIIETAKYAYSKSKVLNNESLSMSEIKEESRPIVEKQDNVLYYPFGKDKDIVKDSNAINSSSNIPNINDYANIGIIERDNNLTFAQAISIVRNKKLSISEKQDAYATLAYIFGKNKKKQNNVIRKSLNDFNKTEKLLSYYGRMIDLRKEELISNGLDIASDVQLNKYTNSYLELLYHLGNVNDDYSYDDFIADEAMRYANDLKEYEEKQKVMKKAI